MPCTPYFRPWSDLEIISVLIVVSALIAALIIGLDLTRRRQPMLNRESGLEY